MNLTRDLHTFNSIEEMESYLEVKGVNREKETISLLEIITSELTKEEILRMNDPNQTEESPNIKTYKTTFEKEEEKKLQKRKKAYLTKRRKIHPDRTEEELEADWELYYLSIQEERLTKAEKEKEEVGKRYFIGSRASRDPKKSKSRLITFALSLLPSNYSGDLEWVEYDKKLTWEENWKQVVRQIEGREFSVEYKDSIIQKYEKILGKKIVSCIYLNPMQNEF
jgi:hypothetical protein